MSRRVVVTGLGAVTPIGNNVDDFWTSVKAGKIGFDHITKFDTTDYKCHIAAELRILTRRILWTERLQREWSHSHSTLWLQQSRQLMIADLISKRKIHTMVGCAIGSGIGSLQAMERETQKLYEKGPNRVNPLLVPLMICNMAAGNVSIQFGLKGKSINDVTACATGTNTIGEAYRSIQYGEADVMVAGGTEGSVCPIGIAGFTALTALSTVDDPAKCSLPFDKNRSGFVMGEGAGVVILEELEHAKARGAKIYAEVVGYGCSSDAYHITSPQEDGAGAARAMTNAMRDAGVTPADVKYINAHGTGTHHNDLFETRAIKLAFGDEAANLKINSTKSMIGHLLGAAGAVEFITCVKEIQDGFIHKTVGYETPDEEIDLNYCKDSYEEPVEYALSNSLGFGGHNASILLKAYK